MLVLGALACLGVTILLRIALWLEQHRNILR